MPEQKPPLALPAWQPNTQSVLKGFKRGAAPALESGFRFVFAEQPAGHEHMPLLPAARVGHFALRQIPIHPYGQHSETLHAQEVKNVPAFRLLFKSELFADALQGAAVEVQANPRRCRELNDALGVLADDVATFMHYVLDERRSDLAAGLHAPICDELHVITTLHDGDGYSLLNWADDVWDDIGLQRFL